MNSFFKTCIYTMFFTACLMMTAGNALAAKKASSGKKGYWVFRTRVINVAPNTDSEDIPNLPGGVTGAGVDVEGDRTLEVDFTYMFNPRFGMELILGTTRHDIVGTGALDGVNIGRTSVLPPTLTAQYHIMPNSKIRPYIGLGINYTNFYAADASRELEEGVYALAVGAAEDQATVNALKAAFPGGYVPASLSLSDSFGLSFQAGVDIMISKRAFVNIDIKRIQMSTTATVKTDAGTTHELDVAINPTIFAIGAGMTF